MENSFALIGFSTDFSTFSTQGAVECMFKQFIQQNVEKLSLSPLAKFFRSGIIVVVSGTGFRKHILHECHPPPYFIWHAAGIIDNAVNVL